MSSRVYGGDAITVHKHDFPDAGTPIYFSVYGFGSASTLMISLTGDSPVTLADGAPQEASVAPHARKLFWFHTGGSSQDITITATPITGSLEIFVSPGKDSDPRRGHAVWTSSTSAFSENSVTLYHTDSHFLHTPGVYEIAVRGGALGSNFSITATHSNSILSLRDGIPIEEAVGSGEYEYFMIPVENASHPLVLDLTPFSGDPDLFVKCTVNATGDDSGSPSRKHYTWRARTWGRDTLTIPYSETHCAKGKKEGGTFYIAVYGFRNSTFMLTASVNPEVKIALQQGVPQYGLVTANEYRRYRVFVPDEPNARVTLTLTPRYGDPDLFARMNGLKPWATFGQYDYRSRVASGSDVIRIQPGDRNYCRGCWARVAVYGYRTSAYTITTSTDHSIVSLQDGVPVQERLQARQYEFFSFFVEPGNKEMVVTVTPVVGDPDLFMSRTVQRPNMSHHTWHSSHWGEDFIVVQGADLVPGNYYISVYAFSNSSFTVQAHVTTHYNETLQLLVPGVPQVGTVTHLEMNYYSIPVGRQPPDKLTISFAARSGLATLYVTTCTGVPPEDCWDQLPTRNSKWSDSDSIEIRSSDPMACSGGESHCSYVVGVYGNRDADYTLTSSTGTDEITLQDGVPSSGIVDKGEYKYYHYTLVENKDVTVTVTPRAGDPDVYITSCRRTAAGTVPDDCITKPNKTKTGHRWQHARMGTEVLTLPHGAMDCDVAAGHGCDIYFGVFGYTNSSYSIMVKLHSAEASRLIAGQPQQGEVENKVWVYYELIIAKPFAGVTVSLNIEHGDADLYARVLNATEVDRRASGTDGSQLNPTRTRYDFRSIRAAGNDSLFVDTSSPAFIRECGTREGLDNRCYIRIGVYGFKESTYTITAVEAGEETTLAAGSPATSRVGYAQQQHFRFYLADTSQSLQIAANVLQGRVTVAAAREGKPDCTHRHDGSVCRDAVWQAAGSGDDVIYVSHTDPCSTAVRGSQSCSWRSYKQGWVHITVYAEMPASFSLVAKATDEVVSLSDGRPVASKTMPHRVCTQYQPCSRKPCRIRVCQQCKDVDVSYFMFQVKPTELPKDAPLQLAVKRECGDHAGPDCAGAALTAYIVSCSPSGEDPCPRSDVRPSPGRHDAALPIGPDNSALLITSEMDAYCTNGGEGVCNYFVAIMTSEANHLVPIRVTFSTQQQVQMLANADIMNKVALRMGTVGPGSSVTYGVYSGVHRNVLSLSLEPCYGSPALYMCDRNCQLPYIPNARRYQERALTNDRPGAQGFEWRYSADLVYLNVSAGRDAEPADFRLYVASGENRDELRLTGGVQSLSARALSDQEIELTWDSAEVVNVSNHRVDPSADVRYNVYVVEKHAVGAMHRADTACGLQRITASPKTSTKGTKAVVSSLNPKTEYILNVVAVGTAGDSTYSRAYAHTTTSTEDLPAPVALIVILSILGMAVVSAVPIYFCWKRARRVERQLQYEMEDVRNVATVSTTLPTVESQTAERQAQRRQGLLDDGSDSLADRSDNQYKTL